MASPASCGAFIWLHLGCNATLNTPCAHRRLTRCRVVGAQDDEWLLQSVWEAMGIHNEKHQHLGQGILGAVVAGLVIFAMIAIANCQTSTKRVRRVAR
jgi:hypothetical protein